MKNIITFLCLIALPAAAIADNETISRLAFGSCNRQSKPQPIWQGIEAFEPQVWIWLGDNIYGDSEDPAVLEAKWKEQKSKPEYQPILESAEIIGTWDDHDYGINNGGKDFAIKEKAQELFLDFFDVPADSPRRKQEGVHWTHTFGPDGKRIAVILLDIRYFRDEPKTDGDILGEPQWTWLEEQLDESDADLHFICSGTQIIPVDHRFEKWSDYPKSRARLLDLIAKYDVPGVIFLSGDRHIAEISKLPPGPVDYPIYEVTASGMTHFWNNFPGEKNTHRVGEVFADYNFGTAEIDWETPAVTLAIRDLENKPVRQVTVPLNDLQPSANE